MAKRGSQATLRGHVTTTSRRHKDRQSRSIQQQIAADCTLTLHSTMHFTMQSRAFTHAFQSTTFTVREFEEGSERLNTYLQTLTDKLNSNEKFAPDDTSSMETTFIHTPGPGSGHSKRYKPSCAAVRGIACHHQEQGQSLLCTGHRHHESPSRQRSRGSRLYKSQGWIPDPRN